MTASSALPASQAPQVLSTASRTWFLAGVRRADRRRLRAALASELQAAGQDGPIEDVVGEDPREFARRWADELGLTDRRLRLVPLVPAAMLAGVVGGSGVLAILMQAFANGGNTVLAELDIRALVGLYLLGGLLAYLAILMAVGAVLAQFHDRTTRDTIHRLARLLPVGAVIAAVAARHVAGIFGYDTRPHTFIWVGITVVTCLVATLAAARYLAVRHQDPNST